MPQIAPVNLIRLRLYSRFLETELLNKRQGNFKSDTDFS